MEKTDLSCVTDMWYDIERLGPVKFLTLTLQATEMARLDMNSPAPLGTFIIRVGGDVFHIDMALLLHLCTKDPSGATEYTFLLPEDMFLIDGAELPCNDLPYHDIKFMINTQIMSGIYWNGRRIKTNGRVYNYRISYTTTFLVVPDLKFKNYQCRAYYNQGNGLPHSMRTRVFVYVPPSLPLPMSLPDSAVQLPLPACFSVLPGHTYRHFGPLMRALHESVPRLPWEMIERIFSFLSPYMGRFYIIEPPMDVCVPEGCRVIDEFSNGFRTYNGTGALQFLA